MVKYSLFLTVLVLSVSCGSGKKAHEEEHTANRTEDVKPGNPGEVTVPGSGSSESETDKPAKPVLHGSWELEKVYGAKEPFTLLFPNKPPTVTFDLKTYTLSGNNGCNQYNGPFTLRNGVLSIGDMMATKMFCNGVKEQLYMTTLKMADGYRFEENKLILTLNEEALLAFKPVK